ncbi:MAG TPA: GTPase ObgE [Spirochaetota bacterium]|nr:GTPase ObgE [Spirochaetota bacterium]HOS31582.1 GTPase ObgE [Spirochaetota bacterium]HOS54769.1 GTPase ObgE [Spirochaetota bacterium]HPK61916.1 GTPase ObgE [Spirochaetota bacterium]HQF77429.1 GTPase ObgE [Spirochaetota bacterium]
MQRFVDEVIINAKSGKGGSGCVSFRREKRVPFGGPDGGDGGRGGSVIVNVKNNIRTLYNLYLKRKFYAGDGLPGMGSQKSGKMGNDVIIEVPAGTIIYDDDTGELIRDFTEVGEEYLLLKGGKGGRGNMHFATSVNQAPRYAQPGLPGQEARLRVELKMIADVGLVGFPNAGKSTLLSVVTKANPKIANYPFTTLTPNLGVFSVEDERFVMADIPGIIEGASQGAGLGLEFLKHIERTKLLLYLIDLSDEGYLDQFGKLENEIKTYSEELSKKPRLIAASKNDVENSSAYVAELQKAVGENIISISSITHRGIDKLLYILKDKIHEIENKES